jgi:hypothetical protein
MDIATDMHAVNGGAFIAPGAPVFRSSGRRAFDSVRDVVIAVLLIWTIPLALALVAALVRGAAAWLAR